MCEYSVAFLAAEERALAFMKAEGLRDALSGGVLLALSGGADSVFLLHLLARLAEREAFPLYALHVHHHLRGEEADRDADFCRHVSEVLSIPFSVVDVDVRREAGRGGVEAAARRLRYAALEEARRSYGLALIATAHHATDHLETVLYQMLRGGGIRAMLGIRPMQGSRVRPLLSLSHREITEALDSSGIPYVTDTTNEDCAFLRNRLRKEVLPPLLSALPRAERGVRRLSETLFHDAALLDALAEEALAAAPRLGAGVSALYLAELPEALRRRLLVRLYEEARGEELYDVPLEHIHVTALSRLLLSRRAAFSLAVPCGLFARLSGGAFFFTRGKEEVASPLAVTPLAEGENKLPGGFTVTLSYAGDEVRLHCSSKLYKIDTTAAFSRTIMKGELIARGRKAGDAYTFCGHTHSLKKLYNEKRIPPEARPHFPLICDREGILFMPLCPLREKPAGRAE